MSPTNASLLFLYNPAQLSKRDLIENFVIREREFKQIFEIIKDDKMLHPPQHLIIQGLRGTGKTTLMLRLHYAVEDDAKLNKWLIPLMSDEESWGINSLPEFWLHVAENLEDNHDAFAGLSDDMEALFNETHIEEKCFDLLMGRLRAEKKKLLLFIDNFGDMIKRFTRQEHQRLREVLLTCSDIRLIAASSVVLEFTYEYSEPFYEFFKVFRLSPLNQTDTKNLLLKLGEQYKTDEIKEIIKNQPERVETLRRITNGVPRTIALLYEIFVDNATGSAFRDLELILDRVTPLYKHRMDDLKPQQQKIVHTLALNWDAMPVKEIAAQTQINSKHVSSQLRYLEKGGIAAKERTATKNHLYYLNERFFNIWYLMRRGRKRHKNKVRFLVEFLQIWCTPDELQRLADELVDSMRRGRVYEKHALYVTEALSYTDLEPSKQHALIEETRKYLKAKNSALLDELSPSDIEIFSEIITLIENGKEEEALNRAKTIKHKTREPETIVGEAFLLKTGDFKKAETYYKMAVKKGDSAAMNNLAWMLFEQKQRKKEALRFVRQSLAMGKEFIRLYSLAMILLWNENIREAADVWEKEIFKENHITERVKEITDILMFFIAKKQYHFVYKLFAQNKFDLRERYKPVYYALLSFMGGKYQNERLKMGPELKETVEEIIQTIKQYQKEY